VVKSYPQSSQNSASGGLAAEQFGQTRPAGGGVAGSRDRPEPAVATGVVLAGPGEVAAGVAAAGVAAIGAPQTSQ
jgi:hypothetical protein